MVKTAVKEKPKKNAEKAQEQAKLFGKSELRLKTDFIVKMPKKIIIKLHEDLDSPGRFMAKDPISGIKGYGRGANKAFKSFKSVYEKTKPAK